MFGFVILWIFVKMDRFKIRFFFSWLVFKILGMGFISFIFIIGFDKGVGLFFVNDKIEKLICCRVLSKLFFWIGLVI